MPLSVQFNYIFFFVFFFEFNLGQREPLNKSYLCTEKEFNVYGEKCMCWMKEKKVIKLYVGMFSSYK